MEIIKDGGVSYIVNQDLQYDVSFLHSVYDTHPSEHIKNTYVERYVIQYCIMGSGTLVINEKEFAYKKGDIFVFFPFTKFRLVANTDKPYAHYSVAMYGNSCDALLKGANITTDNPTMSVNDDEMLELIKKIHYCFKENSSSSILRAHSYFMLFMAKLYEKNPNNNENKDPKKKSHQAKIIEYIKDNYQKRISVSDIADYLYLNRTYISQIFKEETGQGIKEYLTNYRLDKARSLLISTNMSLEEISKSTGFNDYSVFYREFYNKIKKSPSFYRKYFREIEPNVKGYDEYIKEKKGKE